jgi:MFS family permease
MDVSTHDLRTLFAARILRMFAYGIIGVVLVLYLAQRGLNETRIGLLLTFTLLGDAAISLWLTTHADRWGRRKAMMAGAALMIAGGAAMAVTGNFSWLLVAATIGVISPTGNEVGPFLAVEQACLAQVIADRHRTRVFAWYNVAGYAATALGALAGGTGATALQRTGWSMLASYQALFGAYALVVGALLVLSGRLSSAVEAPPRVVPAGARLLLGLHESRGLVARLSALFALDAFGGGFILQSVVAYWLHQKFQVDEATLGAVFFGTNILSGVSALAAVPLARRIGLVNTMVWTHLPSNLVLIAVPLMPTFPLAVAALLVRHMLSQMDVPTRQSYVNAIVPPAERSAANGVTGTARQLAAALAPTITGSLLGVAALTGVPFFAAGGLKILYDLNLWRMFRPVKPPEEKTTG